MNLSTIGPLGLSIVSIDARAGRNVSVLLEVVPLRSSRANTPGLTTIDGWPIRYEDAFDHCVRITT